MCNRLAGIKYIHVCIKNNDGQRQRHPRKYSMKSQRQKEKDRKRKTEMYRIHANAFHFFYQRLWINVSVNVFVWFRSCCCFFSNRRATEVFSVVHTTFSMLIQIFFPSGVYLLRTHYTIEQKRRVFFSPLFLGWKSYLSVVVYSNVYKLRSDHCFMYELPLCVYHIGCM